MLRLPFGSVLSTWDLPSAWGSGWCKETSDVKHLCQSIILLGHFEPRDCAEMFRRSRARALYPWCPDSVRRPSDQECRGLHAPHAILSAWTFRYRASTSLRSSLSSLDFSSRRAQRRRAFPARFSCYRSRSQYSVSQPQVLRRPTCCTTSSRPPGPSSATEEWMASTGR